MNSEDLAFLEQAFPWLGTLLGLLCLLTVAWLMNAVIKKCVLKGIKRLLASTAYGKDPALTQHGLTERLANVMPPFIIMWGILFVPHLPDTIVQVVRNVASAFIILTLARAIFAMLNIASSIYNRHADAIIHPIKGYVQVVKLVVSIIACLLIIAVLIDRSPMILLSGLGAMAAVLLLVFQDTLLSLVASVQISSSDMVRVGDWIEMPQLNADGDVIDIALHTVKVQNWDKTITTIPIRKLITDPFKNWRGMQESGGRRIKRALYINQNSIHFLSAQERTTLQRFALLHSYIQEKEQEVSAWNATLGKWAEDDVNTRRMTNIGCFRAYIGYYLRAHPGIHQHMTLLVRQLSPTPDGLPLEIYCFTNNTDWAKHETTQSDIFDHLLAILPEFGLEIFQNPSGEDLRGLRIDPHTPN